ncbi:MAG: hypothetical protein LDL31_07820, partial [Prosthecobacter sp.]|nr:hypothetical protein [Prosthecobacter sp.]
MKTILTLPLTVVAASGILAGVHLLHADNKAPEVKLTPEQFQGRLKKDTSPLPAGGQLQMSYASVVDKILPSVVTVF